MNTRDEITGQDDGRRRAFYRGYGGQLIYIVPAPDLTVLMTSDETTPRRSGYRESQSLQQSRRKLVGNSPHRRMNFVL